MATCPQPGARGRRCPGAHAAYAMNCRISSSANRLEQVTFPPRVRAPLVSAGFPANGLVCLKNDCETDRGGMLSVVSTSGTDCDPAALLADSHCRHEAQDHYPCSFLCETKSSISG